MQKKAIPDLRETYSAKDYKPFGGYIFYRLINNIYQGKYVYNVKKPFDKFYSDTHIDSGSLYICVSSQLYMSEDDVDALSNFIYDGNTAFISAAEIDTSLLAKFDVKQENNRWLQIINNQAYSNTSVSLVPELADTTSRFSYYYQHFLNYFPVINSNYGRRLGMNELGFTNMTMISWGRGKLYLHCEPRAFSNYFLLTKNNTDYAKQVLQWLDKDPGSLFWDDYYNKINYKKRSGNSFSTIGAIMQHPALAMAFWIALLLLLFYIIFEGKRRQRIVPVIKPVENSSIEFTEAIAGLYLSYKNNKNIAEKIITYFHEYIRSNYFLNVHNTNKVFLTSLSKKSGVPQEDIDALFYTIQQTQDTEEIADEALIDLNNKIQQFYKKRT